MGSSNVVQKKQLNKKTHRVWDNVLKWKEDQERLQAAETLVDSGVSRMLDQVKDQLQSSSTILYSDIQKSKMIQHLDHWLVFQLLTPFKLTEPPIQGSAYQPPFTGLVSSL